jgi:hypothetical protein
LRPREVSNDVFQIYRSGQDPVGWQNGKNEASGRFPGSARGYHRTVKWQIRAAMSFGDLATAVKACMKIAILKFLLSPKQWFNKQPNHPGDF